MLVTVERFTSDAESTLGALYINGHFRCFTLEDQHRDGPKVPGETRIPAGVYDIGLRKEGGFHNRYGAHPRIGEIHKGMLHVQNVKGFEWILLHVGNTDDDTAGCILVGRDALTEFGKPYRVGRSVDAYMDVYPEIAAALSENSNVTLEIIDRDRRRNF